jgi:hypothetical protein
MTLQWIKVTVCSLKAQLIRRPPNKGRNHPPVALGLRMSAGRISWNATAVAALGKAMQSA